MTKRLLATTTLLAFATVFTFTFFPVDYADAAHCAQKKEEIEGLNLRESDLDLYEAFENTKEACCSEEEVADGNKQKKPMRERFMDMYLPKRGLQKPRFIDTQTVQKSN